MLLTFILLGIEHSINHMLMLNEEASASLVPLIDKTVQITLLEPYLHANVVFGEHGVRFESVPMQIFEMQDALHTADAHMTFHGPADLLAFVKLPYHEAVMTYGHDQILMDMYQLCQCFNVSALVENLALPTPNTKFDLAILKNIIHSFKIPHQ